MSTRLRFLALYIYSDSIADLGNTDSEAQFFDGWIFHLMEQYRILKPGHKVAIHCKDTMRYMSSHKYAGLYDFPGQIVRLARSVGFLFERWITIWKDPVIEMQRTKTYGLLHKSFCERAEVTRQGCADFVLILRKPKNEDDREVEEALPLASPRVIERCVHQWTNEEEIISTPLNSLIRRRKPMQKGDKIQYSFWNESDSFYTPNSIQAIQNNTTPGRLTTIHCTPQMMTMLIQRFESVNGWKFHSRVMLTDGSFLVTFRNWSKEFATGVVKHSLKAPETDYQKFEIVQQLARSVDGEVEVIEEHRETWRQAITRGTEVHADYVGTQPPIGWRDDNYYSILTWQRYASPVWFDLEGLPKSHKDAWMDIKQTNVLNAKGVKEDAASKHICPLQLDLIERLILEYTEPGQIVLTPYGGIGSEGYQAIKLGRKAIVAELKPEYWYTNCKNLTDVEIEITQRAMI